MANEKAGKRVLTIQKEGEQFVFRYIPGNEEKLLDAFVDLANNEENNFDWFDAAVLSFQLSKNLVEEADKILCPNVKVDRTQDKEDDLDWDREL
ncbi:MAG: hypothetical protein JW745_01220 [Sedimentisphaerales bacterium]|nr:hypothetical protein [Sedimentisphaerales bacterium]MBN2843222.1 hypothetical protein [Sedimentisphaerales bacterium]